MEERGDSSRPKDMALFDWMIKVRKSTSKFCLLSATGPTYLQRLHNRDCMEIIVVKGP